jgi:hypothetical protein
MGVSVYFNPCHLSSFAAFGVCFVTGKHLAAGAMRSSLIGWVFQYMKKAADVISPGRDKD